MNPDNVARVKPQRDLMAKLRAAGADVRYTEYPDERHGGWAKAYRTQALFD